MAAANLAEAARVAALRAGPVVVVHDCLPRPTHDLLRSTFGAAGDVRHLIIGGQRRGPARVVAPDLVRLGLLRSQPLQRAVALAAGRLSPEQQRDHGQPASLPPLVAAGPAPRVLVVEDDPTSRQVALRQLQLLGLQAEAASSGQQALALWRHKPFALLLTDLHMPGMDGYELVHRLRAEEAPGERRPMLALTANALKGEAARALQAGMDDCLTKPITLAALHQALARWLGADPGTPAPSPDETRPESAVQPTQPVLDERVLVRILGDDPAALRDFLQLFQRSAQAQAQELRVAFDAADAQAVAQAAHKFKSMARSVGALALGDLCADIEAGAVRCSATDFQAQQRAFETALDAAQAACTRAIAAKPLAAPAELSR